MYRYTLQWLIPTFRKEGGEGLGHPDPQIRRAGAGLTKTFFLPFRPRFGRKIRRRGWGRSPLLDSPVLYTVQNAYRLSLRLNISVG